MSYDQNAPLLPPLDIEPVYETVYDFTDVEDVARCLLAEGDYDGYAKTGRFLLALEDAQVIFDKRSEQAAQRQAAAAKAAKEAVKVVVQPEKTIYLASVQRIGEPRSRARSFG